jgi:molybdopterin-guanine dinucleotide biosynthesis protein A
MTPRPDPPIGVILAGGAGRRIGGAKATVKLRGRPMIEYPLAAVQGALDDVVVIAKADTELPNLPGVTIWIEPILPQHPVVGILHALALAAGRRVLVCAADMPFVTSSLIGRIAAADAGGAAAVVAAHGGAMHPLLGRYETEAADGLRAAGPDVPLRAAVAALSPRLFEVTDADVLFNVNAPDDLLQATGMLDAGVRAQPNVKS